jgi:hypothetical protein
MVRTRHTSRGYRWLASVTTLALIAVAGLIPATSVAAAEPTNMVVVWNENAVSVISAGQTATPPGLGQGPPLSPLHLAMVHGAVYDAVNAIDGGHEPYLDGLSAPASASKAAAVAQAAHDVLVGLTPASLPLVKTRVDDMLTASLSLIDDGQAETDGRTIGAQAAAAMLLARSSDGRFGSALFDTSNDVGRWRVVAPANANVGAHFATVTPLTMKAPDQFRTEGPLDMASPEYAAEFNEVKALGAQTGSSRTEAQTLLAGFVTANPVVYMNRGLREIAVAHGLSTTDQARLFVKTSMASADALLGCYNDKDHWNVWRPQTAIREAADDGNPATSPDANWLSLFPSPGYPDHPSGYNCFTGGMWHSARLFFGTDQVEFQLTSPGASPIPGSTRSYTRFTGVIDDTINGRILNGFHFRTPDVQGAWIGKKAAQWIDKHYFAPVD